MSDAAKIPVFEVDMEDLERKPRRMRWAKEFPNHLRTFSDSLSDLELLNKSHIAHLFQCSGEKEVMEKPTAFLNAATVLLCGSWEAFIEDLAQDSVLYLVEKLADPSKLPLTLRKLVAARIKQEKNELSPWFLASDKWKDHVRQVVGLRIAAMHSPKSVHIAELFHDLFAIDVLETWKWEVDVSGQIVEFDRANTISFIDGLVQQRGAIAHGRTPATDFPQTSFFLWNVALRCHKVASLMHCRLNTLLSDITGELPWVHTRFTPNWASVVTSANDSSPVTPSPRAVDPT